MTYLEKLFRKKQRERAEERRVTAIRYTIKTMLRELKEAGKLEEGLREIKKVLDEEEARNKTMLRYYEEI